MTFAVTSWRSAALASSIADFLERVSPVVFEQLHATGLVIRALDSAPPAIETLAAVHVGLVGPRPLRTPRHALGEAEVRRIRDELANGVRFRGHARHGRPWIRAVLSGLEGSATQSWMVLPLQSRGETLGVAAIAGEVDERDDRWAILQESCAAALAHHLARRGLERVREAAEADRAAALGRLQVRDVGPSVIGEDAGLREVMQQVETVAPTDAPVLILGETGSGKEVVARSIHERSARRSGPVLRVNCGAIPPDLVDSELFGHERGAFTGAHARRRGLFEQADGGTLLLDEIGETSPRTQVMLLRVLQEGRLRRLGGEAEIRVNVRVLAATHRDLAAMVAAGQFREDLYYRLRGATLELPPLRERGRDLELLVAHFLGELGRTRSKRGELRPWPTTQAWAALHRYRWPGNIRELRAEVVRWTVFCDAKVEIDDLSPEIKSTLGRPNIASDSMPSSSMPIAAPAPEAGFASLAARIEATERAAVNQALERFSGNLSAAARALEVDRNTLKRKLAKYGMRAKE